MLIDAGWESEQGWQALLSGLGALGAGAGDVSGVLATHNHLDHIGLARRIIEESGAWFGMHPADAEHIEAPHYRKPEVARRVESEWMRHLGATPDQVTRVMDARESTWGRRQRAARADRYVAHSEVLAVPGRQLRAVHVPGHTPGQVCFVDDAAGLLFAGDHLLPRISPNVPADRRPEQDALGDYLDSLQRVSLDADYEVLPAHEWRFRGAAERAAEITAHHQGRLAEVVCALRMSPGATAWDIAAKLTWSRPWEQYGGYVLFSAVNETMAHLMHLVHRGTAVVLEGSRTPRFAVRRAGG
ncbi:hypothetical protein GFS60_06975 (plasmid) [Rhodococcus sp. WAY2]|nr:hypothetical protein GFS60_06975 [Rhodococcus sp. WAY2]